MGSERVGCQEPTLRVALPYAETLGDLACDVMEAVGEPADEAQRGVLRDWLARDGSGRWVHTLNMLEAPRQNMKTWDVKALTLTLTTFLGMSVLYTAHNGDTAAEFRDEMFRLFGDHAGDKDAAFPWLNRRVSRVRHTNGHEAVYLRNGGRVYFSTRTKNAKRGFTVDALVLDEAQELQDAQSRALISAASAGRAHNSLVVMCGTPPTPGCWGDVFQVKRDEVASGAIGRGDGSVSLNEWSATDLDGFDLSDAGNPDWWYRTNPALGTRIDERFVRTERATFVTDLSFAQERLGFWLPREQVNAVIGARLWGACATDDPPRRGTAALGVKFSPDGSRVCACAARHSDDGDYVELVFDESMARGVGWLAEWMAERRDRFAAMLIDGRTGSADLMAKLRELGVPRRKFAPAATRDVAGAAAMMVNAVNDGTVSHWDDEGQRALDVSAASSTKRGIGDGFGFDGDEATPLEAASLALYAARTARRRDRGHEKTIGVA